MTADDDLRPIPSHRPGHFLLGCALVLGGAAVLLALAFLTVLAAAGPPAGSPDVPTSTTVVRP